MLARGLTGFLEVSESFVQAALGKSIHRGRGGSHLLKGLSAPLNGAAQRFARGNRLPRLRGAGGKGESGQLIGFESLIRETFERRWDDGHIANAGKSTARALKFLLGGIAHRAQGRFRPPRQSAAELDELADLVKIIAIRATF